MQKGRGDMESRTLQEVVCELKPEWATGVSCEAEAARSKLESLRSESMEWGLWSLGMGIAGQSQDQMES